MSKWNEQFTFYGNKQVDNLVNDIFLLDNVTIGKHMPVTFVSKYGHETHLRINVHGARRIVKFEMRQLLACLPGHVPERFV